MPPDLSQKWGTRRALVTCPDSLHSRAPIDETIRLTRVEKSTSVMMGGPLGGVVNGLGHRSGKVGLFLFLDGRVRFACARLVCGPVD